MCEPAIHVLRSVFTRLIQQNLFTSQWCNFVPGCPWVPVTQSGVDAPGGVILGTTQLTQGCNAQAWVPPKPGCPRVCPPWALTSYATVTSVATLRVLFFCVSAIVCYMMIWFQNQKSYQPVNQSNLMEQGRVLRVGIETSPVKKSLSISAKTTLSRDFGLRHIASVKCCPYIFLMDHGPGPVA